VDEILYEVDGHVATITTNRPQRYNSLDYEAYRLLTRSVAEADADPEVRAIIWSVAAEQPRSSVHANRRRGWCRRSPATGRTVLRRTDRHRAASGALR